MSILVLDDDKKRLERFRRKYPNAVLVETAEKCIQALQSWPFDVIYLDHDLGGETYVPEEREDTGSGVARFLAEGVHKQRKDAYIICHSPNFDGRMNMISILRLAGFTNVKDIPFTALVL